MNFTLPEELTAFRDLTRKFAAEKIAPHARKWDAEKWIPDEVIREMGKVGILGVAFSEG